VDEKRRTIADRRRARRRRRQWARVTMIADRVNHAMHDMGVVAGGASMAVGGLIEAGKFHLVGTGGGDNEPD